ncbi:TonB-dependent receptor [Shewanella gaetbuli]
MKKTNLSIAISLILMSGSMSQMAMAEEANTEGEKLDNVEVIQIKGVRGSLAKAAYVKQSASGVQESIVAEDIGKFPDQNVAESLQRLTGVSISRTNGEGDGVTIRGFGPRFNNVRLNGRTLAAADGDRGFDFQVLPSEVIRGADVYKSTQAYLPDGSLGGYINLQTMRPLSSRGFNATVAGGARYEDQSKETTPRFSGLVSNTFADDTVGVMFALGYEESETRIDRYQGIRWGESSSVSNLQGNVKYTDGSIAPKDVAILHPRRVRFLSEQERRERLALAGSIQFVPNDSVEIIFDALSVDLKRENIGAGFQLPTQAGNYSNVVINRGGTIVSADISGTNIDGESEDNSEDQSILAVGTNANWQVNDNLELEFDVSYSKAEASPTYVQLVPQITGSDVSFSINNLAASGGGDVVEFDTGINLNDPSAIRTHWNGGDSAQFDDEVFQTQLHSNYNFDDGILRTIKFGGEYTQRTKNRKFFDNFTDVDTGCSPCGGAADYDDNLFVKNHVQNYLSRESGQFPSNIFGIPDIQAYKDATLAIRSQLGIPGDPFNAPFVPSRSSEISEDVLSLYTQFNFEGSADHFEWFADLGLRYSDTQVESAGFRQIPQKILLTSQPGAVEIRADIISTEATPVSETNKFDNFLPSANFKLDFLNGYIIRGGVGKTMSRPAMEHLGVDRAVSVEEGGVVTVTGGNVMLQPYEVISGDLSFEYYADNGNAYSLGFFYKQIDQFISTLTQSSPFNDPSIEIDPALTKELGGKDLIQVTNTNLNREGGTVSGIEASALYNFDELPGIWSNFGIQANYTYVTSKDEQGDTIGLPNVTEPVGLEGLAKNTYNVVGFYDDGKFQGRLAYNWRDSFLLARTGIIGSSGIPEHTDSYGQLDFSSSYNFTDKFSIALEAINLTNERSLQYADSRDRVTNLSYTGRRFFLTGRYTF